MPGQIETVLGLAESGPASGRLDWDAVGDNARLAAIVTSSPDAIISVGTDARIASWNPAAEQLLGYGETEALGASIDLLAPESAPDVPQQAVAAALAGGRVRIDTTLRRKDGTLVEISLTASRIQSGDGRTMGAVGILRDITERRRQEVSLRESEAQVRALADAVPQLVWASTPDGHTDYYNRRWYDYVGAEHGEFLERDWPMLLHPDDRSRVQERWEDALRTGEAYDDEYRVRRHDGVYRWFLDRALPVRGQDGRILRWFGTCTDVDEQKQTEDARQLLIRELNHRVKNLFAVASGIVSVSARRAGSVRDMAEMIRGRLGALARAHDAIHAANGGSRESTTLQDVIRTILAPHSGDAGGPIAVEGPSVAIGPNAAAGLALVLHELATNAVKYGALSAHRGQVRLAWSLDETQLLLEWQESGGPAVDAPPASEGFGTQIARMTVAGQLGGQIDTRWESAGVRVRLALPIERLRR